MTHPQPPVPVTQADRDADFLRDLARRMFRTVTPAIGFDQGDTDQLYRIANDLARHRQAPASEVREALDDCADALARFTHSTLLEDKHVQARAALNRARTALSTVPTPSSEHPWTTRLAQINERTRIEKMASSFKVAIEHLGGHTLLTDALNHADRAMRTLGAWHDAGEPGKLSDQSFADAADGLVTSDLEVELWAAGADHETAKFVARRLVENGLSLASSDFDANRPKGWSSEWRDVVIDELVVAHVYSAKHDDDPKLAIRDVIAWNVAVALDPVVSQAARDLRDASHAAGIEDAARCADAWAKSCHDAALIARRSMAEAQQLSSLARAHEETATAIRALHPTTSGESA